METLHFNMDSITLTLLGMKTSTPWYLIVKVIISELSDDHIAILNCEICKSKSVNQYILSEHLSLP